MAYWNSYPKYVPVAEKRAKAENKLKQLMKKNSLIKPVCINGSTLATTWWGKSWNKNLERYADYSNRIGRGRSYVRHGAVLDLQIEPCKVIALVQGSRSKPYCVTIKIKAISANNWNEIKEVCKGKINSLKTLLIGQFPKALEEIFTEKGKGLFPTPEEIDFSCSCPDWAYMCKHVAATLYGIGARLDTDTGLLFSLRNVEVEELISTAVKGVTTDLLKKADKKSARIMDSSSLSDVFGIDMITDEISKAQLVTKSDSLERPAKVGGVKKRKVKDGKGALAIKEKTSLNEMTTIEKIIRRHRNGITTAMLVEKSGINVIKVRHVISQLKKQNKIKSVARGVYQNEGNR